MHSKNPTHDSIAPNWPAIVKDKEIRKTYHNNEWWFVVSDVVRTLTGSEDSGRYIRRMKKRDPELEKGWGQIVTPLPVETTDSFQKMDCANMEGILRIIQSIRTPKPEPFKQWLAKVGYERIQKFLDPESVSRHRRTDTATGGVQTPRSRQSTERTTNLEIIFFMLGEAATAEITGKQDIEDSNVHETARRKGSRIVDEARRQLEAETVGNISMHDQPE